MEVFPKDILLRVGPEMLRKYQSLVVMGAGRGRARPVPYTFTRAAVRRVRGFGGVGNKVAADKVAISYPSGTLLDANGNPRACIRFDGARTQLVTDPENFGAWSIFGTPVRTAGQADPFGGTAAYLIEDNDGSANEGVFQAVPFTGDATKAPAIFLRQGSAAESALNLRDDTAGGVIRHQVKVTWTAGVPSLSTIAGAGILFAVENWGGGWWRISFNATGVIAANTNNLYLYPAGATVSATGTTYFFGANAWDAPFPSSYQGPGEAAGAADLLTVPFNWGADVDVTVLARMARPTWAELATVTGNRTMCAVGTNTLAGAQCNLLFDRISSSPSFEGFINTPTTDRNASGAIPAGDSLATIAQFRNLLTGGSVNVDPGTGLVGFSSAATAADSFSSQTLYVGASSAVGNEFFGDLIDLTFFRGLFTRAEALAAAAA